MRATILTTVLEDGSEIFDLNLGADGSEYSILIPMGSLEGCHEVIATMNNHMIATMEVSEDICRY